MVFSDHQAPHEDFYLHQASLELAKDLKPDAIIVNGDLYNLDAMKSKKYHQDALSSETFKSSVAHGSAILNGYRTVCDNVYLIGGNHEARFDIQLADWNTELAGLAQLQFENVLGLDDLGVRYVRSPRGYSWPHSGLMVGPHIEVTHSWMSRRGSGNTARAMLPRMDHSFVIGHTHTVGLVTTTRHQADGGLKVLLGIEGGTMCEIGWGLGYARNEDWQNGFVVITVAPDGVFTHRQVLYLSENRRILW